MVKRRYILLLSILLHSLVGLFALPSMCFSVNKASSINVVFIKQIPNYQSNKTPKINKAVKKSAANLEQSTDNTNTLVGNNIVVASELPQLLHSVMPDYPENARKKGIEATFNADLTIDNYGNVVAVTIAENTYLNLFKTAIEQALYQWKFASGFKQKTFTVPIVFKFDV